MRTPDLVHGLAFHSCCNRSRNSPGRIFCDRCWRSALVSGQVLVLVLAAMMPLLGFLYRARNGSDRAITMVIGFLVGHAARHWVTERGDAMLRADWSGFVEPYAATDSIPWLGLALVTLVGAGHFLFRFHGRQRGA